jgi:ribosomal protein L11 methyltransferase
MTSERPTRVARLEADEATAKALADSLSGGIETGDMAIAVFERAPRRWVLEATFDSMPDEAALRARVAALAGETAARALVFETIAPRDWISVSLAGLKPVAAGRFVVHGRHDRARIPANRIGLEIEASLAFGTGHHGTTRGCLLALDAIAKARQGRESVLDLGTGSGVLAIAAAKALRSPVLASDIDRQAVRIAAENARTNGAASFVELVHAAGPNATRLRARAPYTLVLANILLGPLKRFAAPLAPLVAPRGRIILSGLLPDQANAVLWAYRCRGFALEKRIPLDGWVTLVVRRGGQRQSPRA